MLHNLKTKKFDYFLTSECFKEKQKSKSSLKDFGEFALKRMLTSYPAYRNLIEKYSKEQQLKRYAILESHGYSIPGFWAITNYEDYLGEVQEWINKQDGNYAAILLRCCNKSFNKPKSKSSPILFPDNDFSWEWQGQEKVNVRLYIPRIGYFLSREISEEF